MSIWGGANPFHGWQCLRRGEMSLIASQPPPVIVVINSILHPIASHLSQVIIVINASLVTSDL